MRSNLTAYSATRSSNSCVQHKDSARTPQLALPTAVCSHKDSAPTSSCLNLKHRMVQLTESPAPLPSSARAVGLTPVYGLNERVNIVIWRIKTSTQKRACLQHQMHTALAGSRKLKLPKTFIPIMYTGTTPTPHYHPIE